MAAGNRFKISKAKRTIVERIKDDKLLGNKNNTEAKNKDLFIYALALGTNLLSPLETPDQWFEEDDFKYEDKAIVYAIAYDYLNDIDKILLFDETKGFLDQMANTGIDCLEEMLNGISPDNFEKKMLARLDQEYDSIKTLF